MQLQVRWRKNMNGILQDVHYALRRFRREPGFTVLAVLILALGIGANTAIFSAVYAVLLRPLPFKDASRLVFIRKQNPSRGWTRNPISPPEILAWRDQSGVFEDMAAIHGQSCALTGDLEAEADPCEVISSNLFSVLGIEPFRGRTFSAKEDKPEGARVALLSYALWRRRFGADESVLGRPITINATSYTVIGIMPSNFSRLYSTPGYPLPEMWLSGIALSSANLWNDYFGIARLKPGVSLSQAEKRLDQVSLRLEQEYAGLNGWRAQIASFRDTLAGDTRPALLVLMGAVIFVLLIACANLANLLLARGAVRANELAVRKALGAGAGRILRQLLTESLLISGLGGALGILLGSLGCKGLAALAPVSLLQSAPGLASGAANLRVLGFSLVAMLITGFVFGIAPAFQGSRLDVAKALKDEGRGSFQSSRSRGFRRALVIGEIALAIVLLVGAGLMVRTLAELNVVKLGFNPINVLNLRVPFSGERYKQPQARVEFWQRVLAAVKALPGVESASVSRGALIDDWSGQWFVTSEQPDPPVGQVPDANYVIAGTDYFRTLQIPLRRGRAFDEHDTQTSQQVAIVNEELARRYWPGQDPIGKQLRIDSASAPWRVVVGVAGNLLSQGPEYGVHSEIYVPYQQFPWLLDGPHNLLIKAAPDVRAESLGNAIVREIHRVDRGLPVVDIATLEQLASEPLQQQRMVMALLVSFAGLALVLSTLGIYSLLSYFIAQRTREIGVRIAMGARPVHVFGMVFKDGVQMIVAGVLLGIVAAFAATRLMVSILFGVTPSDPATFALVSFVLSAAALLACYVPARRAMKVDPMVALRYE
jgi:putative ABC transport system permease protein